MAKSKKTTGTNQKAKIIVDVLAQGKVPSEKENIPNGKNPAAVALGRLGGLKGGKARAKKLSAKRRKDIARKAAQKRWAKE